MIAITGYTLFINLVSLTGLHQHSTVSRPAHSPQLHIEACNTPRGAYHSLHRLSFALYPFCHLCGAPLCRL